MSANGISSLSTKEAKQLAKLNLASLKRQGYTLNANGSVASGPDITKEFYRTRNQYDITELPTKYDGNNILDNPNPDGLISGRPWLAGGMVNGVIWRKVYDGNFESDGSTFTRLVSEGAVDNIWNENVPTNTTYEFLGYFRADWTGTWSFTVDVDDAAFFWIGPNAQAGGPGGNRDLAQIAINSVNISTYNIDLIEGNVYPFRLLCANGGGPGYIKFYWQNGLTETRALSLDAAMLVNDQGFFSTDVGGTNASFVTPGIVKTTDHGGVVVFEGTEKTQAGHGYAKLADDFYADFSGGISISVWANVATGSGIWSRLIDFGNGAGNDNILIALFGSDPTKFCMQVWNGNLPGTDVQVLGDVHFDQWKMYTLTGGGGNYRWYVNDQLVNTLSGVSFLPNNVTRSANWCRIGGSNWETINDWNLKGSIASVEVYTRPLDLGEITGLFNERKGRFL